MIVYKVMSSVIVPINSMKAANAGPFHKSPASPCCWGMSLTRSTNDDMNTRTIWN